MSVGGGLGIPREDPATVVVIGLPEVYREMQTLLVGYQRFDAKLEMIAQAVNGRVEALNAAVATNRADINDLENRMRAQEMRRVVTPQSVWTALAVITAIAGVVVALVLAHH